MIEKLKRKAVNEVTSKFKERFINVSSNYINTITFVKFDNVLLMKHIEYEWIGLKKIKGQR